MPLDASAVRCAAFEINERLKGGRIEKVYQPEKDEIVLAIKANEGNVKLVISANSQNPRILITNQNKENPMEPPMFCMLMRKHVSSGRISYVKSIDFERIIDIAIESRNEMGDVVTKHIMCEIMGKNSNIILLGENGKIIDSIKHVDLSVSRVRNVFPGLTYNLPPDNERKNPLGMTQEDFYELLTLCGEGKSVDKALTASLQGISPLFAREAAYRAIGCADVILGEMKEEDMKKVSCCLYEMFKKVKENQYECVVLYKEGDKKPMDFAVFEITQYGCGFEGKKCLSVCEAMEEFYSGRDAQERMRARSYALLKNVTNQLEKIRKKVSLLHNTLKDSAEKEKYRIAGDIITANLYQMKQGDKSLTAINYYDEEQKEITIKLDETLSPSKNAQQYYKKYAKAKTASVEAAKQIEKAMKEMEYLESVALEIEMAKSPTELDEIKEELVEEGIVKTTFAQKKKMKRKTNAMPEEYCYNGYTIYAGKNNVQNDYLTLKMGRSTDLWLHTKNIPGSHVLVKNMGEEFPLKVIEVAAIIAATNSKGRNSSKVEVDYCPVSHVKKPNGAKAGMVIYEGYSTASVTPDEQLCASLKKLEESKKNRN